MGEVQPNNENKKIEFKDLVLSSGVLGVIMFSIVDMMAVARDEDLFSILADMGMCFHAASLILVDDRDRGLNYILGASAYLIRWITQIHASEVLHTQLPNYFWIPAVGFILLTAYELHAMDKGK